MTALFLLSFTALLFEHFFAKPNDVIAAGVSVLTLLIPARGSLADWGTWYWAFLYYEVALVVLATAALLLLTPDDPGRLNNRISNVLKTVTTRLGSGKIQYFCLFFLSLVFFIEPRSIPFIAFLAYGIAVLWIEPHRMSLWLPAVVKLKTREAGEILAVEGGNSFIVRLHAGSDTPKPRLGDLLEFRYEAGGSSKPRRGVVVERMFLDQAQWVRAVCHETIDAAAETLPDLDPSRPGAVYRRVESDGSKFYGTLVGFVADRCDVGTLRFLQTGGTPIQEGDLVEVATSEGAVAFQVVNGVVDTESLDARNEADFVVGEAVQLGRWDATRGVFVRHGWVPSARSPVTKLTEIEAPAKLTDEIDLGCIPGTRIPVLLNKRDAVSHHTAILGVTGVGKSMFARQLVRQLSEEDDLRIIVVDFTREWKNKLAGTVLPLMIDEATAANLRKAIKQLDLEMAEFKTKQDQHKIQQLKTSLRDGFRTALDDFLKGGDRVRVFELPDLSNTEGVLEYTQRFLQTLFYIARESGLGGRRVCIVLEEAHTVIPEWNFVGIADKSSQSLVNNISQIALQGRKYDVGFIVIAQRTASVSKTVLTQCNTVIAFQCFDGTSLEFLSHYLPGPVVRSLPNLGFRRAVAVGKAIRGSVPLIFEVPDLSAPEPAPTAPIASLAASS
ncbi:MAG: ATP-binding protein [Gemmatimonadaceae bacterium]